MASAQTLPATLVNNSSATLNGLASAKGLVTDAWFEWGLTTNFGNFFILPALASNAFQTPLSASISGLTNEGNYYFRLVVSNSLGPNSGGTLSFFTLVLFFMPMAVSHSAG